MVRAWFEDWKALIAIHVTGIYHYSFWPCDKTVFHFLIRRQTSIKPIHALHRYTYTLVNSHRLSPTCIVTQMSQRPDIALHNDIRAVLCNFSDSRFSDILMSICIAPCFGRGFAVIIGIAWAIWISHPVTHSYIISIGMYRTLNRRDNYLSCLKLLSVALHKI